MKKIILVFVFLFSSIALAEKDKGKGIGISEVVKLMDWTFISKSENGYSYYLNLESFKSKYGALGGTNDLFSYYLLVDYPNPKADGTLSVVTAGDIDCKALEIKSFFFIYFDENMARGKATFRYAAKKLKDWRKPKYNSGLNKMINKTCKKYALPGTLPDEF